MARNPSGSSRGGADIPPAPRDQAASYTEKSELKKPTFWVNVITLIVIRHIHLLRLQPSTANSNRKFDS
jgi:hypothetical protein